MLSDSESETDNIHQLTINEHYAKAFEYRKEREELQKLKDKYGSDADEDESEDSDTESDESEDEDGEELTPAVDAAIFRTLAKIKRKDPDIYTKKDIFQDEQKQIGHIKTKSKKEKDKSKPVTIRQAALESALDARSRSPSPALKPHVEEQRELRDETIKAFHGGAGGGGEDDDDFLVPREKTKDELEREEEEYKEFLEREVGEDLGKIVTVEPTETLVEDGDVNKVAEGSAEGKKEMKKKKKGKEKAKSKGEEDQEFLMSYILNRGWIDRTAKRIPTYGEITSSKREPKKKKVTENEATGQASSSSSVEEEDDGAGSEDVSSEDEFDELADTFESSYNFRFEEPDAATIKTYPREIPSAVRRDDTKRKEARERKKTRKEEEMQKKREEIRRMKALKMKEIRKKLERIGKEGGKGLDDDPALRDLDLEGDWDPEAHDKQMSGLYGEDEVEVEDGGDAEKPQWDDDIDIWDIVPPGDEGQEPPAEKKKKKKKKEGESAMEDGVDVDAMDADADAERLGEEEEWDGTEEMRKRKLDEYMDEVYGLDFNDMVSGIPTRFHYASIAPESYSLSAAEILTATDKELNEYMGVKKYAPYRQTKERWDPKRKEKLTELKAKVKERAGDKLGGDGEGDKKGKRRMGKKERDKKKKGKEEVVDVDGVDGEGMEGGKRKRVEENGSEGKKKRKRHKKSHGNAEP